MHVNESIFLREDLETYGKYIPPGNLRFLGYSRIFYHDGRKEKNYMVPDFVRCIVTGPSLNPSFEHILIDFKNYNFTDGQFIFDYKADEDQSLYAGDTRKERLTGDFWIDDQSKTTGVHPGA